MAFFGVTQLGYQDTIREHVKAPAETPQYVYRSGMYRNPSATSQFPPISPNESRQVSGHGPGQMSSYKEYCRLKEKHIRSPEGGGPGIADLIEIYRRPVTNAQEIAKWRKDEPLREREPWTYVKRHIHVQSEMTKFVKDMSLTNRQFTLY